MTVEPQSYRIDLLAAKGEDDFGVAQDMEDWLTEHGVLVPDSRLQAIADAPKCKHELIDRHQAYVLNADLTQQYHPNGAAVWKWCEGAPELRAAIAALIEENNDDA